MRVYVSSTFTDLQEHRQELRNALQSLEDVEYVGPEYLSANAEPSLETSLREIGESTALVLLIGWRYGYIPEGQQKSIVELEYEAALVVQIKRLVPDRAMSQKGGMRTYKACLGKGRSVTRSGTRAPQHPHPM